VSVLGVGRKRDDLGLRANIRCRVSRVRNGLLRGNALHSSITRMEREELISRSEVTAMREALADIHASVRRVRELLEDEGDGEEEVPEADS